MAAALACALIPVLAINPNNPNKNQANSPVAATPSTSKGPTTPLVVPLHVADLDADGHFAVIPKTASPILLEIGSSDRNTVDLEVLPLEPNAFLVTAEPLVDKYARALGRRRPAATVLDGYEPLGRQHDRGMILPIAVAPGPPGGESRTFNVHNVGGCSSLLATNRSASFGSWCHNVNERRKVWTVPLSDLLGWIGREVDFLKIDAQGVDLAIVQSGGARLKRVARMQMEVISDDCRELYSGQPRCSQVVSTMQSLGYAPLRETPCAPVPGRRRFNHYCEMEIVFQRADLAVPESVDWSSLPLARRPAQYVFQYHNLAYSGCIGSYEPHEARSMIEQPPAGKVVVFTHHKAGGPPEPTGFVSEWWSGIATHSSGRPYICPCTCVRRAWGKCNQTAIDTDPYLARKMRCPWG